jgi:uncharacterized protein YwqG
MKLAHFSQEWREIGSPQHVFTDRQTAALFPHQYTGPMRREKAIELIRSSPLAEFGEMLVNYLSPSARIIVRDEPEVSSNRLSASFFGGLPLLPKNAAWPTWDKSDHLKAEIASLEKRLEAYARRTRDQPETIPGIREIRSTGFRNSIRKKREELSLGKIPLAFLGQFSLREVCAIAPLPGWPREGILAFFYDASQIWGYDPLDRGHCRVLFYPEEERLTPAEFPTTPSTDAHLPRRSLEFRCEWTLPTYLELNNGDLVVWKMDEYSDLLARLSSDGEAEGGRFHRVGGYPQEIQGDMRLECQLVTNGLYCGDQSGYQDPRRAELEKGASDWQLLAQFDSDEAQLGWMWGDVGRVYFWARRQEIEAGDFTNCWAILQCG